MTEEEAFAEYKAKFGSIPKVMEYKRGFPDDIIVELLEAVETNTPIQEVENVDKANW